MTGKCELKTEAKLSPKSQGDRYVSFVGLDCEGKALSVLNMVLELIAQPEVGNKFWDKFKVQVEAYEKNEGLGHDPLYLLHANVFYICELFEEQKALDAIATLDQLEATCF